MELGVCYYPEHWPEETWRPDAERMKAIGLSWVRIGEFAWSVLEPEPDRLDFGWLDRAVDTLGDAGLKVVLGTPTATPPKWLVDRYPNVLPVDAQGRRRNFGSRRHYCFNAPEYRSQTRRIVTHLAERYGRHEAVRAWQIDNEFGCHDTVRCYCDACRTAFRLWLEARYGSPEALNRAWFNVFWSMEVTGFDQIDLPNLTVTEANPSHSLDYYRFASDSVASYSRLQAGILRQYSPDRLITHNAMLFFGDFDHYTLATDLDVLTWDSYPLGMLEQSLLPAEVKARYLRTGHPDLISFHHDLYRGVKDRPFWVMEQQPGQVNWASSNPLPAPGAVRLWTHQAFAHGADVVSYFRWRAAPGAQEQMHAGLNLHDGHPDHATDEVRTVVKELPSARPGQAPRVALLFDYENLWATGLQPHAQGWNYWSLQLAYYSALRALAIDVDVVPTRHDLANYALIFAPALHLVDDALARRLSHYVETGAHLILGPRSGAKTTSNLAHVPVPGPLGRLAGVRIDHVDALRPGVSASLELDGRSFEYHTWADLLTPTGATVIASYTTPTYEGVAAITRHAFGEGFCTTIGAWGSDALHRAMFHHLLSATGVPWTDLPEGIRLTRLRNPGLLVNFSDRPVAVDDLGLGAEQEVILEQDLMLVPRFPEEPGD